MNKLVFLILSLMSGINIARSQQCAGFGQTPITAILVCGAASFPVGPPGVCGSKNIPAPCGDGFPYQDKNPHFFRMNCFGSGTLGFSILPEDPSADYNWQLFDITNTNPSDIFTNPSLFVACNWSGEPGETGASIDGTSLTVCSGSQPLWSKMPDIVAGRTYLLMVSNNSGSSSGYQLTFDGGSASITDAVEPHANDAFGNCSGASVTVRLNKGMKCNTMASDGSDFTINGGANILAAHPASCNSIGLSDLVVLSLDRILAPGTYTITVQTGTDGNTVIDLCGRPVPDAETVPVTIAPPQPTPMDSIKPASCAPGYIELVFKKQIDLASIAADGSDFIVTGPQPLTLLPNVNFGLGRIVRLNFSPSTVITGTYQVQLVRGTDGNTLLDECGLESAVSSVLSFDVFEPVTADFTYSAPLSCRETTASFFHDGNHHTTSWSWSFGNGVTSTDQNPVYVFSTPGTHTIKLTVSNSQCSDTHTETIVTSGFLSAAFDAPKMICPNDTIHLVNNSSGNADSWQWNFGNGNSSIDKTPSGQRYADIGREAFYTIQLIAYNAQLGCGDTTTRVVKALSNCNIKVPTAFTPNGDGRNDLLYPLNALKADDLLFRVYNRYGQQVFVTRDWTKRWDGTMNGKPLSTGIYVWMLSYIDRDSNKRMFLKGTTLLLR